MKKVKDHYFMKAKAEGHAARSFYKIEEIDRKLGLIRPGKAVLDLGCAPGGWLQYAWERMNMQGTLVGVDLNPLEVDLGPEVKVVQGDIFALGAPALLALGGPYDVMLSDMAPKTTGIASADATRSAELVLRVLELAGACLKPKGAVVAKIFHGARFEAVRADFRRVFDQVTVEKPKSSRPESVEVFLVGRGLKKPDGFLTAN